MTKSRRIFIKYLGKFNNIDNSGLLPKVARQEITFVNDETFQVFTTTDLNIKKKKRNKSLEEFGEKYNPLILKESSTVIGVVADSDSYPCASSFIHFFKKKLKRKGIAVLGYVSIRDVGNIKFKKHLHVLLSLRFIDSKTFKNLFKNKKHSRYDVIMLSKFNKRNEKDLEYHEFSSPTLPMMIRYLSKKEIYGVGKQRSFSKSKYFLTPKSSEKACLLANKYELC